MPERRGHPRDETPNSLPSNGALIESTIGLFKTELIKPQRSWKTLSQVELATAELIDWYIHRPFHGEMGHIPADSHGAALMPSDQLPAEQSVLSRPITRQA